MKILYRQPFLFISPLTLNEASNIKKHNIMETKILTFVIGFFTCVFVSFTQQPLNANIVFSVDPQCYGDSTGAATANATGGVMPYTYSWDDPNNTTNANVTGLPAGTWTVLVTDAAGDTSSASVTLENPPEIIIDMNPTDVTSCGVCDGEATANATGGTGALTYSWDNGENGQTITGLCPDFYTVTVTDQNMCTAEDSVEVAGNTGGSAMTLEMSQTPADCGQSNGSASVVVTDGQDPYTYSWDDPNQQTTATATGLVAGTYTVTVTDDNGCTAMGEVTVTNVDGPELTSSSTLVSCNGGSDGSATVDVAGGTAPFTYLWDDSNTQTTQTATDLSAGIYTATVTDDNGCIAEATVEVQEPTPIIINITSTSSTCGNNDGSLTATPNGGTGSYTYLWDDPSAQITQTASNLLSGNYTVTVTDVNGCQVSETSSVSDADGPVINITSTLSSCSNTCDGSLTANINDGNGPFDYLWSESADNQTTQTAIDLCAGEYTVTVTDANGCSTSSEATLNQPAPINTAVSSNDNVITAENDNADSYQWINCDTGEEIIDSTNNSITIDASGSYAVIITEGACTDTSDCLYVEYLSVENEAFSDKEFTVFPNPTKGVLKIKGDFETEMYTILSLEGKTVKSGRLKTNSVNERYIDVSSVKNGMYVLSITSNNRYYNKKILIQK